MKQSGCMTSVPEVARDVDATELFIIKKIRHAPRADCMKSGHEIASLDEEMMEIEGDHGSNKMLDETVATIANCDQDEATDDEDSECKCGDEFASLGREMREVSLDGKYACSSLSFIPRQRFLL